MLAVLFLVLVGVCALAPFLGKDTSDSTSEWARPETGWYPRLTNHHR